MKKIPTLCLGIAIGAMVPAQPPAQGAIISTEPMIGTIMAAQAGRSVITGTIFVEAHHPIADIWVELQDDFNATLGRVKPDASGRFTFSNLLNGNYRLRVLPYGTDYKEQIQEVTLVSVSVITGRPGADRQVVDIYLKRNDRAPVGPFAVGPRSIFVQ